MSRGDYGALSILLCNVSLNRERGCRGDANRFLEKGCLKKGFEEREEVAPKCPGKQSKAEGTARGKWQR